MNSDILNILTPLRSRCYRVGTNYEGFQTKSHYEADMWWAKHPGEVINAVGKFVLARRNMTQYENWLKSIWTKG